MNTVPCTSRKVVFQDGNSCKLLKTRMVQKPKDHLAFMEIDKLKDKQSNEDVLEDSIYDVYDLDVSDSDSLKIYCSRESLFSSDDSSEAEPVLKSKSKKASSKQTPKTVKRSTNKLNGSRNQKTLDYDKVIKNLPKFKGQEDDHFEAWMINVNLYLKEQCPFMTNSQKVTF